jgi:signal transduction histidine kinase/ActR/RegA family two-component response regulator
MQLVIILIACMLPSFLTIAGFSAGAVMEPHAMEEFSALSENQAEATFHQMLQTLETKLRNHDSDAAEFSDSLLEYVRARNDGRGEGAIYRLIGSYEKDRLKATEMILKALDVYTKNKLSKESGEALTDLAELSRADVNYDQALKYLDQALNLFETAGYELGLGRAYNRMAAVFFELSTNDPASEQEHLAKAIDNASKSLAISRNFKNDELNYNNQNILGAALTKKKEFDKATGCLFESLAIIDAHQWIEVRPNILNNIARVYYETGRYDDAIQYAAESYELAKRIKIEPYMEVATTILSQTYAQKGDYKKAYEYLQENAGIRNLYYFDERNKLIVELQEKYELKEKEHEIQIERNRRSNQTLLSGLIAAGGLIIGSIIFIHYLRSANRIIQRKNDVISENLVQMERLNAENLRAREQFRIAAESADIGIWEFDLKKNELHWDHRTSRHFACTCNDRENVYESFLNLIHPDDRISTLDKLKSVNEKNGEFHAIFRVIFPEEKIRYMEQFGHIMVDKAGGFLRLIGVNRDITDRVFAEEERLEIERRFMFAQKLESLGLMAGGIAHDFNNLLTAIVGNLDLALKETTPNRKESLCIERALAAAQRATNLTHQMLAYSGKGPLIFEDLNLNDVLQDSILIQKAAVSKNIAFEVQLSNNLPMVRGDQGSIRQIIANLISNAAEAIGDKQGKIILSTGSQYFNEIHLNRSRIEAKPSPGHFVWLDVTDMGSGMDKATMDRIFDPFFTTKFMGRGLGLSAVIGIVRGHGGAIFVESKPGEGTSFQVLLAASPEGDESPSADSTQLRASIENAETQEFQGTILLVDDEEIVRVSCSEMLKSIGLNVYEASDGNEAIKAFEQHLDEIDCIILDLTMPNLDGAGAFPELLRLKPEVKIILSSGYTEREATSKFANQGLTGFLHKPYRLQNLVDKLNRVVPNLKRN